MLYISLPVICFLTLLIVIFAMQNTAFVFNFINNLVLSLDFKPGKHLGWAFVRL